MWIGKKKKKRTWDVLNLEDWNGGRIKGMSKVELVLGSITGLISGRLNVKCWLGARVVSSDRQGGQQKNLRREARAENEDL